MVIHTIIQHQPSLCQGQSLEHAGWIEASHGAESQPEPRVKACLKKSKQQHSVQYDFYKLYVVNWNAACETGWPNSEVWLRRTSACVSLLFRQNTEFCVFKSNSAIIDCPPPSVMTICSESTFKKWKIVKHVLKIL